jgi:hypothetical protein
MKCNELKPLFMDFIYDEISDEDRNLFVAHLAECESCQRELEALKQTSHILQKWEDVDPDFNVVMVTEKASWLIRLKDGIERLLPKQRKLAYGLAYAAVAVFLLLAIANTEISYRQGEFNMSMGLFSKPSSQQNTENYLTQEFIEQLQKENYYLMSTLLQQSEANQRKEMASAILQLRQDFETKRIEDLNLVGVGLNSVEENTVRQLKRTDNSLNEIIRYINAQRK